MSTLNTDRKLPLRVLIGFPLANFGPTLQTCIQMYFLLYFYTNVLGISGSAAAIIILIARIWDFINDPLMAVLVEKTHKPSGKCLFWMRCSIVPLCIFMVLAYTAPQFSTTMKIVWALVTFIGLGMTQTAYSIPINSLRPKLTTDKVERNKLNTFESITGTAANILIPAVTMPFFAYLSGLKLSQPFMVLAAVYAGVYLILSVAGQWMMRGSEIEDEEVTGVPAPKITTGEMFKALFENKVAMLVLLAQLMHMFFSSLTGSALVYYVTYNLHDVKLMSITSSVGGIVGLLPLLFLVPLYKKFGNAGTAFWGNVICIAVMAVRFITHDANNMIFISMSIVEGIGVNLVTSMMYQCLMDSIDYGEWKTGKKTVPILMSTMGIGTKIGLAFGGTAAGFVLGLVKFNAKAAVQPAHVLNAFFGLNVTAPLVIYTLMALIFLYLRKIEKKLPEMRKEVEERKAAAAANAAEAAQA